MCPSVTLNLMIMVEDVVQKWINCIENNDIVYC